MAFSRQPALELLAAGQYEFHRPASQHRQSHALLRPPPSLCAPRTFFLGHDVQAVTVSYSLRRSSRRRPSSGSRVRDVLSTRVQRIVWARVDSLGGARSNRFLWNAATHETCRILPSARSHSSPPACPLLALLGPSHAGSAMQRLCARRRALCIHRCAPVSWGETVRRRGCGGGSTASAWRPSSPPARHPSVRPAAVVAKLSGWRACARLRLPWRGKSACAFWWELSCQARADVVACSLADSRVILGPSAVCNASARCS